MYSCGETGVKFDELSNGSQNKHGKTQNCLYKYIIGECAKGRDTKELHGTCQASYGETLLRFNDVIIISLQKYSLGPDP